MSGRKILAVIFLVYIFASFGIAGCSTIYSPIEENEISPQKEDIEPIPSGSVMPMYFESENELKDFVTGKTTLQEGPWNPEYAKSLEYYFIPEYIPKESNLSYISVHDVNVVFCYEFDQSPDEWLSNVFLLEWFRSLNPGDMEKNVTRMFSDSEIEQYKGYVIYVYNVMDELEKKEYSRQDIFWEQDGYAFHAVVPIWFTKKISKSIV